MGKNKGKEQHTVTSDREEKTTHISANPPHSSPASSPASSSPSSSKKKGSQGQGQVRPPLGVPSRIFNFVFSLVAICLLMGLAMVFDLVVYDKAEKLATPYFAKLGVEDKNMPFFVVFLEFLMFFAFNFLLVLYSAASLDHTDNNHPRLQKQALPRLGQRMHSSLNNFLENFPMFACAVIAAHVTHVPLNLRIGFSVLHLFCRFVYHLAYMFNLDLFRSTTYFMASHCVLLLFLFSIFPELSKDTLANTTAQAHHLVDTTTAHTQEWVHWSNEKVQELVNTHITPLLNKS